MRLRTAVALVAICVTLVGGCAKQSADFGSAARMQANEMPASMAAGGASAMSKTEAQLSDDPSSSAPAYSDNPQSLDRYLIRNAILDVEVKDAREANDRLIAAVRASKGYVSNLQETTDGLGARSISMQVRVPASGFEGSMQQLADLGKVMSKSVNAEDVTEEYVDTESTLRNLRRTENRLIAHLARTGKLSDTLLIEKELSRVRQEIERREGRLRFLAHRVQFSTIDVTLREAARAQSAVPPESYSTGKEASDATRSLVGFMLSIWTVVIWLGIWSAVWVPMLVVASIAVKLYRGKNSKRTPPAPPMSHGI